MNLLLLRRGFEEGATEGSLYVEECHTLEDAVRPEKIPRITAIPAGTYRVIITHSPRFNRPMPLLLDVPGFTGVRIHSGNKPEDTEGCILVGKDQTTLRDGWIGQSKAAYNALYLKIRAAIAKGEEVWLTIEEMR